MSAAQTMAVYAPRYPNAANAIEATKYIGVTDDVGAWLRRHLIGARNGSPTPVHAWLRELGGPPTVVILGTPGREWAAAAERASIAIWRAAGAPLLNRSEGGNGALTTEQRLRVGATLRERRREPERRLRWPRAARRNQRRAAAGRRRARKARRGTT